MSLLVRLHRDVRIGIHAVQQLAVNVQLFLTAGSIADPHWFRSAVTVQVSEWMLRLNTLATNSVQNLQLIHRTLRGFLQEVEKIVRLAEITTVHQRRDHELRVAQPG